MRSSSPAKPDPARTDESGDHGLEPLALPALPERPLVSILIANYNYERFLAQAVESATGQTYPNVEIVFCDDGSSDGSIPAVRRLAAGHDNLTVVEQENRGHFAALNAAFGKATGDIVAFLDSDDYFRHDKMAVVVDAFRRRPDAGMVVHPVVRVDSEGEEHGEYPFAARLPAGWLGPEVLSQGGYLQWIQTGMICLRREVADRILPMDEMLPQGPDIFLRAAASLLAPVVAVDETLAYYRLHGSNQGNTAQRFSVQESVERREKELVEFGAVYTALDAWLRRERPGFALPPFESTRPCIERRYVIARLTGAESAQRARLYTQLMQVADTMTPRTRAFYRMSPRLPRPLFKAGLDLVYGQGRLKKLLGRVADLRRPRQGAGTAPKHDA